jgi:hypothetical protein
MTTTQPADPVVRASDDLLAVTRMSLKLLTSFADYAQRDLNLGNIEKAQRNVDALVSELSRLSDRPGMCWECSAEAATAEGLCPFHAEQASDERCAAARETAADLRVMQGSEF